jgi:hypothetical protein
MCCIVFQIESTREVTVKCITGINVTKINTTFEIVNNEQIMIQNMRDIGAVSGGPTCVFNNIHIPCLVQYLPHGGRTPTFLKNDLCKMDLLHLFPQEAGKNHIFCWMATILVLT